MIRDWRGGRVVNAVYGACEEAIVITLDRCVTAARGRLRPGRGYITGHMSRSTAAFEATANVRTLHRPRSNTSSDLVHRSYRPTNRNGVFTAKMGSVTPYSSVWQSRYDPFVVTGFRTHIRSLGNEVVTQFSRRI